MEEIIVDENKFLASFGDRQLNLAEKYIQAKELQNSIKTISEISRLIKHPERTIYSWLSDKRVPFPIRALNYLKSIRLIPLKVEDTQSFLLFTELSAFLFGDGHLMKHLGAFSLFGEKEDLELIASLLFKQYKIEPHLAINSSESEIRKIKNRVLYRTYPKGGDYRLNVNSSPLARLLFLAGAPVGDKVSSSTKVPDWVMNSDKEIKRAFLSVLFGNELQCPFIRAKNAFTSATFGLHKVESKVNELIKFHEQVKSLLAEFGVTSSPIAGEKNRTLRKDGTLSQKISFYIDGRSPNIVKLFQEIPFKYAEKKQAKFVKAVETFLKNSSGLKKEWETYEKTIQLRSTGLSADRILEKLRLPKNHIYKITGWIYYGRKPLYYDSREILEWGVVKISNL
ncbi:MAG: hypothetical protein Q7R70_06340 [Candidatus Diapherotrites archaeon]|nr:hypothetical protein [Candidatus Diapherotrites archaeon]